MFVITGGGSGIGRALAWALATRNQHVLIVGRQKNTLIETANFSPLINWFVADVSLISEREKLAIYLENISRIHGLIHNAGVTEPIISLADLDISKWQVCMATNLEAPLFLTQLLLPKLQNGRVLHVGSGAVYYPAAGWAAYCVSKAALSMLTRCWQLDYPQTAFTSVLPGIIDTPMQALLREAEYIQADRREFFKQLKENNRLLTTETVALFLTWLLLDINSVEYAALEWDIYDTAHHARWLVAPHVVPAIND